MRSVYALVLIVVVILFHDSNVEGLRPGGLTSVRDATPEVQAVADAIRTELESRSETIFDEYVAVQYATQVVAGLNYFIKVHVGHNDYVHLRVFKSLKGDLSLASYKLGLTSADPLTYF